MKRLAPDLPLIKSLIVGAGTTEELESVLFEFIPYCEAFITDTYDLETGACGATGKTHDGISAAVLFPFLRSRCCLPAVSPRTMWTEHSVMWSSRC